MYFVAAKSTPPPVDTIVHDIAFDFYGKRFATCSTDSKIKVWDLNDEADSMAWTCVEIPEAHTMAIWRLSWAHPEFGSLIASCSDDKSVCIWEEQIAVTKSRSDREKWIRKAQLSDSKKPLNDVKFGPRHLGLQIAAASADGSVRIYEATDVFTLNYWHLQDTLMAEDIAEHGVACISWNERVFDRPELVVGSYSGKVAVWCKDGGDGSSGKWRKECDLESTGDAHPVHDVSWAPAMGRSYHLIATACRTNEPKIHKLVRPHDGADLVVDSFVTLKMDAPVWRVTWNATGTVLATSSEDGTLSLWKKDFQGEWTEVQRLPSTALYTSVGFATTP